MIPFGMQRLRGHLAEGMNARGEPLAPTDFNRRIDQLPMPQVYAVEKAQTDDGRPFEAFALVHPDHFKRVVQP